MPKCERKRCRHDIGRHVVPYERLKTRRDGKANSQWQRELRCDVPGCVCQEFLGIKEEEHAES